MAPEDREVVAEQLSRCAQFSEKAVDFESNNLVWAHNRWRRIFGELYPREDRK
jgi:hypothetical protein